MKKIFLLSLLLILLFSKNSNSQITFIGFDQPECLTYSDFGYTYENIDLCNAHGYGYKIFQYGSQVFYKCDDFGSYRAKELRFTQSHLGFLHETYNTANNIYKTNNSGATWTYIGGGAPIFHGWQMINENTGYLVTSYDTPLQFYINRISDFGWTQLVNYSDVIQDTILYDTIYGGDICSYDSLSFSIIYEGDTISYEIRVHYIPVDAEEINTNEQFVVYPNPVSDYLEFPAGFFTDDFTVKIYDCNFRLVSVFHNPQSSVYFGNLDPGFYFVEFKDSENRWIKKVIRQ